MTLSDANIKERYIVEELSLKQPIKRRLEAMGLIEGTMIRKNNEATDGSVIFTVRGTRLAVGKDVADYIEVRDILPGEERGPRRRCSRQGRGMGHNRGKWRQVNGL